MIALLSDRITLDSMMQPSYAKQEHIDRLSILKNFSLLFLAEAFRIADLLSIFEAAGDFLAQF